MAEKKKELQFIQSITDNRGNNHSVLIYGKNDLRIGNMRFKTMKEVKVAVNGQWPKNIEVI